MELNENKDYHKKINHIGFFFGRFAPNEQI